MAPGLELAIASSRLYRGVRAAMPMWVNYLESFLQSGGIGSTMSPNRYTLSSTSMM
jgi:hypothetical protein